MQAFNNLIISASAGTGKTYRLSLEYIALILRYYRHEDFSLDSILALTFTRKASYEIRERILLHLESLEKGEATGLIENLNQILGRTGSQLSTEDQNILASARREIMADKRKLQVGTIDSYISQIFRNIVRPLRSIDNYDIDLSAIDKRMPYLLNHLMQPQIRVRLDRLLQRKVRRTLDDYADLFASMIERRWLYYLIKHRCVNSQFVPSSGQELSDFESACENFAKVIETVASAKKGKYLDYLSADARRLLSPDVSDSKSFEHSMLELLKTPIDASRLLKLLAGKNIYMGNKIRAENLRMPLNEAQTAMLKSLADHLYHQLLLPEQAEILELWEIILKEYDRLIYRYKNMTYDDISWFSFEALFSDDPPNFDLSDANSATEFYHFLSFRTRFLLIDEFQDTSLIQFNILKPIMEEICSGYGSKSIGGIIVVGDEKQSIFGWRGGERDLLLNLKYLIPSLGNVSEVELDTSWRSSKELIGFINHVFADVPIHKYLGTRDLSWDYRLANSGLGSLPGELELKLSRYSRGGDTMRTIDDVYRDFVQNMILPALEKHPHEEVAILCRKTKELNELQLLLEENSASGIFQPSASIVDHLLVKALISWLRFVCYQDWYYFLVFLRSDFLRLSSKALKTAVDAISDYEKRLKNANYDAQPDFEPEGYLKDWLELAANHREQSPYQSLRELLAILYKEENLKSKRDYLNLDAFLALVKNWELTQALQGATIPDLLDYLEDNARQESFNQVSVEGEERLQLLTIHKAKGLQFDRVFVFYRLGSKGGGFQDKMYHSHQYSKQLSPYGQPYSSLHYLDAYALTFHHEEVLKHSKAGFLWEANENMEILEELNTLYVAFTRAKTSLHVCFAYENQMHWEDYYQNKLADSSSKQLLPIILANSCRRYFEGLPEMAPDRFYQEFAAEAPAEEIEAPAAKSLPIMPLRLKSQDLALARGLNWDATRPLDDLDLPWRELYLKRPQHLYGDLAHYYLSFIRRDTADEHSQARLNCINRYGSLIKESVLLRLFKSIVSEIQKHSYLFDPDFDRIYTEFAIENMRVDRLMLNTLRKEAWLVDYKTGGVHEKEQIQLYQEALMRLPALADYRFLPGKYISLKLEI